MTEKRKDKLMPSFQHAIGLGREKITVINEELARLNQIFPGERYLDTCLQDPTYRNYKSVLVDARVRVELTTAEARRTVRGRLLLATLS